MLKYLRLTDAEFVNCILNLQVRMQTLRNICSDDTNFKTWYGLSCSKNDTQNQNEFKYKIVFTIWSCLYVLSRTIVSNYMWYKSKNMFSLP